MKRYLILLFLLPSILNGQTDSTWVKRPDVLRVGDGVIHTFTSPARWKGNDWLVLGGLLAGTAVTMLVDEPIRDFWIDQDNEFLDQVSTVGDYYGRTSTSIAVTGSVYLMGILFKDDKIKETGVSLATGLITSQSLASFLKWSVGRARPFTEKGAFAFDPFSSSYDFHSLPSGHASNAFMTSAIVVRQTKSVPLKIIFYTLAATTVVNRMYEDQHWFSDIAFGGTLGWFCADAALDRIKKNRMRVRKDKNRVSLKTFPFSGGLCVRICFP